MAEPERKPSPDDCERCGGSGYDPEPETSPDWCYEGMCRECEGSGGKHLPEDPEDFYR